MKIDSKKIAELTGVSRSTVSRVISNSSLVKEETKAKVMSAIEKFGYIPNKTAQALAGKKADVIGIFIYDEKFKENISEERSVNLKYYFEFITKSAEESLKNSYQILVDIVYDEKGERRIEGYFNDGSISGGIFVGFTTDSSFIQKIIKKDYRVCLIDYAHSIPDMRKGLYLVNTGDYEGAYKVTEKIIKKGYRKIVFVEGINNKLSAIERKKGYKKALEDYGIKFDESLVLKGEYEKIRAKAAMKEFLEKGIEFDAVFSASDNSAFGVREAVEEKGSHLENIEMWGFDNLKYTFPKGIKTVSPLLGKTAAEAVKSLILQEYGSCEARYTKVELIEDFESYLKYS